MQTFLPYPDFEQSAKCLDNRRLGKQRVEAYQILKTLLQGPYKDGNKTPWYNHPAVQMWKGHERALTTYGLLICSEWKNRSFKDTLYDKIYELRKPIEAEVCFPSFIGNEKFHASHRSNLLRKDPKWYGQFGWAEEPNLPYCWPTKENKK